MALPRGAHVLFECRGGCKPGNEWRPEPPESKNQLKQLQERFEKRQRDLRESFERMIREQQAQIDALRKQLEAVKTNAPPLVAPALAVPLAEEQKTPAAIVTLAPPPAAKPAWSPAEPIRMGGQRNYINLSFDALVAAGTSTANDLDRLESGGHDPKQRGFSIQNLETVFEGAVDPYFRGQANLIMQIDPHGDTTVEAEEAYLESMSLPWNLQVKAGQFFTDFGRLNATHPHTWDFVDVPLPNVRFFGEDGLRNPGARLSWLAPTPFYSELFLAVQNSQGGTAYSYRDDHDGNLFSGRPNPQGRRNFSMVVADWGLPCRYLVHDRDTSFGALDHVLKTEELRILKTPPHAPLCNAFTERHVRAIRETLDQLILMGEGHLRRTPRGLAVIERHHNSQRPHQGLGNLIPLSFEYPTGAAPPSKIRCEASLGGLLNHYCLKQVA